MSRPRILVVLSADFGEFVTASLFCRGQDFEVRFALPQALARFAPPGLDGAFAYGRLAELGGRLSAFRPDIVLLASGYLFTVNGIAGFEELRAFMAEVRRSGAALATTDPWLRIWALRPRSRFTIHSVRQGGIDPQASKAMTDMQRALDDLLAEAPHIFAVPLTGGNGAWRSFYNPRAAAPEASNEGAEIDVDEWLFVLSGEDYVFLAGFERQAFFDSLAARVGELLAHAPNRLRFIAPPEIGRFLGERWGNEPRVIHTGYCDFEAFERYVRNAKIVVYWNMLSSSLLYCLYYGVPPVFFGAGHLARVCPGLEAHALEHVYRGRPPARLALDALLEPDADTLISRHGLRPWLAGLTSEFAGLQAPAAIVTGLMGRK
jgi:hypothetical protein